MSLLLFLTGAPQGGQGIPPDPEPEPEPEVTAPSRRPGGALGRGVRRRQIVAVSREYRDAEDELVMTWLL